jgi:hypothetical protein
MTATPLSRKYISPPPSLGQILHLFESASTLFWLCG